MSKTKDGPTAAADWRATKPITLDLPSGNVATVKKPSLFLAIKTGRLPENVRAMMEKSLHNEPAALDEVVAATEWLVAESFVEPQVSLVPREGAVCIADIDDDDKQAVVRTLDLSLVF
jgi:hypothetical protein